MAESQDPYYNGDVDDDEIVAPLSEEWLAFHKSLKASISELRTATKKLKQDIATVVRTKCSSMTAAIQVEKQIKELIGECIHEETTYRELLALRVVDYESLEFVDRQRRTAYHQKVNHFCHDILA